MNGVDVLSTGNVDELTFNIFDASSECEESDSQSTGLILMSSINIQQMMEWHHRLPIRTDSPNITLGDEPGNVAANNQLQSY